MSLAVWFRVIRIKFLLSSIIAVSLGLTLSYWQRQEIDVIHAAVTVGGVIALHASVDLLNDFWDYKRGIDALTKKTKFSGGTGVLPEGLLRPSRVYWAGVISLVLGSAAGVYFVISYGWVIAAILGFAVLSIYFYSTKIVDSGLGEVFVGTKGTMIVLGTVYIQTQTVLFQDVAAGVIIGTLSAFVLYITSFPDHDADKEKGRRTLVIVLGKKRAASLFWAFPIIVYLVILGGSLFGMFSLFCLITFAAMPLVIMTGLRLKQTLDDSDRFVSIMRSALLFSRTTGVLFITGFLIQIIYFLND